jgi:hypothetical protein
MQTNYHTHLNSQEIQDPSIVFEAFFDHYHLETAQQELETLVHLGLTTDDPAYDSGEKRSNLLCLHQQLLKLIEATHLLAEPAN